MAHRKEGFFCNAVKPSSFTNYWGMIHSDELSFYKSLVREIDADIDQVCGMIKEKAPCGHQGFCSQECYEEDSDMELRKFLVELYEAKTNALRLASAAYRKCEEGTGVSYH